MTAGVSERPDDDTAALRPLCFVLMPFGDKQDDSGRTIHFDAVFHDIIQPAVVAAGLECIRADEEKVGGIIHTPMFERLMLCEYAVADLTTANANVYYELGIRHAVRSWSTALVCARGSRPPFDVAPLRVGHYDLDDAGTPHHPQDAREALAEELANARRKRQGRKDSPVFQLVEGYVEPDLGGLNSEAFRDRVSRAERIHASLRSARRQGIEALITFRQGIGAVEDADSGVLVELLQAFASVQGWAEMVTLVEQMPDALARLPRVREQYALALNRIGRDHDAQDILEGLIRERGPSGETYGLLGRVYKDRWESALREGRSAAAAGLLDKAIETYRLGFESDLTDYYPGINAVELMTLRDPRDPDLARLLPVVTFSATVRSGSHAGYWEYATLLQLAVMQRDQDAAEHQLRKALAADPDPMKVSTTADSLRRVRAAIERDGENADWIQRIETELRTGA